MIATRTRWIAPASFVVALAVAPASPAQTGGGADRYLGATQRSLARTDAMIGAIAPSYATGGMGSQAMAASAMGSIGRTDAMMRSILANRAATIRGMEQQVIHRTPDILHGVYWQNYYASRARMFWVQGRMYGGFPQGRHDLTVSPHYSNGRSAEMMAMDALRRRAQDRARGEELSYRFAQRSDPTLPNRPPVDYNAIQAEFTGSDLLDRQVTIMAPTPIPRAAASRRGGRGD